MISNKLPNALPPSKPVVAVAALALALLAGCGGGGGAGGGGQSGPPDSFVSAGTFTYPPSIEGSPAGFFVDANDGGGSSDMQLLEMSWGRLVDVYDSTDSSNPRFHNVVIEEDPEADGDIDEDEQDGLGGDFQLTTDPITQSQKLTIQYPFDTASLAPFLETLEAASDNLGPIQFKSDSPSTLPPFSFVPRNAAIVLKFSDLLDPNTINLNTVKLLTGYPPENPGDARILSDPNHGGLVSGSGLPQFRPTRILIDTTVSEAEAGNSNPPLPVNVVGLPASLTTALPNVSVRIPTKVDFGAGQFQKLANTTGHGLPASANPPFDFGSATLDLVRAMRSGGKTSVTADTNNGFLFDKTKPRVVGFLPISISSVVDDTAPLAGPLDFLVDFSFSALTCAQTPEVGDIIELPGALAQVTSVGLPPSAGQVDALKIRLVAGSESSLKVGGSATYETAFNSPQDNAQAACFVAFFPSPGLPPTTAVSPSAQVVVRFTKPIDPESVQPFDTFTITRVAGVPKAGEIIVAEKTSDSGLRTYTLQPSLPLNHVSGTAEQYFFNLTGGTKGVTDLAGNALLGNLPQVSFKLDSPAATGKTGGLVLKFNAFSELEETGTTSVKAELRDNGIVRDLLAGLIRPRGVSRFSGVADRSITNTLQAFMTPVPADGLIPPNPFIPTWWLGGVKDPLSPLGSRLMTVWRYCDLGLGGAPSTPGFAGLGANAEEFYNIDVEGLDWTPYNGNVVAEFYPEFEIDLAHCTRFPDEFVDPACIPPTLISPVSGLLTSAFDDNVLQDPKNVKTAVHPKSGGYLINPSSKFLTANGTPMVPYPLNSGPDVSAFSYYTWRDTAIQAVDGPQNLGVEPGMVVYTLNQQPSHTGNPVPCGPLMTPLSGQIAATTFIPSVCLPLLMEFKCYPTDGGLGLNALDTALAVNPNVVATIQPFFRIFSTGGHNQSTTEVEKNPDLEPAPSGGFNDNVMFGPLGAPTPNADDMFYMGQADFVVRITRVPTIWFNTNSNTPEYVTPIILPKNSDQPAGTSIVLAFRGANGASGLATQDANCIDAYGDQPFTVAGSACVGGGDPSKYADPTKKNTSITFFNGDKTWKDTIQELNGRRFFQARLTFINNTATQLSPVLSALGFAFTTP